MEVHLDLRSEVDWRGIGIDAALSVIMLSLLGGKIAEKVLKTGGAKVRAHRSVRRIVKILES